MVLWESFWLMLLCLCSGFCTLMIFCLYTVVFNLWVFFFKIVFALVCVAVYVSISPAFSQLPFFSWFFFSFCLFVWREKERKIKKIWSWMSGRNWKEIKGEATVNRIWDPNPHPNTWPKWDPQGPRGHRNSCPTRNTCSFWFSPVPGSRS